jgi:ABC-type methionine transport system permease subunit
MLNPALIVPAVGAVAAPVSMEFGITGVVTLTCSGPAAPVVMVVAICCVTLVSAIALNGWFGSGGKADLVADTH